MTPRQIVRKLLDVPLHACRRSRGTAGGSPSRVVHLSGFCVSILPQIGFLRLRDSLEWKASIFWDTGDFPYGTSRHFGLSARSQKFPTRGMTPAAISLRLLAFSISRLRFPYHLTPNCRQNGHPKTTQCTTPSPSPARPGPRRAQTRTRGRSQEAKNRPNMDWQEKIHGGILRGLRNMSETP